MRAPARHPGEGRGPDSHGVVRGVSLDTGLRRYDGWKVMAALLLLAGCAHSPPPLTPAELETYPDARGMPAAVQDFIVRHTDCSHWLGEPEWDAERRRQIEQAIVRSCFGVDAYGRRLRARYSGNAEVMARLREYEPLGQ